MRHRPHPDPRPRGLNGLLAAAALALGTACAGSGAVQPPASDPYIIGPIESVEHRATGSGVHVAAGPGSRDPCGIVATVDAGTRVMRRAAGGGLVSATAADLRVGEMVEVYVEGPVMESCPLQGRAGAMVLIGGAR